MTTDELEELFRPFGVIVQSRILMEGIGFVRFMKHEEGIKCEFRKNSCEIAKTNSLTFEQSFICFFSV